MNDRLTQVLSYALISGAIVLMVLSLTVGRGDGNAGLNFASAALFLALAATYLGMSRKRRR
jgi:hypothetical protein